MKSQKKIEDILRKRFQNARSEPSPSLKERIFGKEKRSDAYIIYGIAASVAIILMLVLILVPDNNPDQSIAENKKSPYVVPGSDDSTEFNNEKRIESKTKENDPEEKPETIETDPSVTEPLKWNTVAAGSGIKSLQLPDGSMVFLNENTEIAYPENFDEQRHTRLSGEAFFEVKSDKDNPFRINAGDASVTVLGTSFNVVVKDDKLLSVHTFNGLVEVSYFKNDDNVRLSAGEFVYLKDNSFKKEKFENQNMISWKTNHLSFSRSELLSVFNDLEDHFNVSISYQGQIPACTFTGTFSDPELQKILHVITTVTGLQYRETGGGIEFYGNCK